MEKPPHNSVTLFAPGDRLTHTHTHAINYDLSVTGRERGGKKRMQREREAASTGTRWGSIWDRSEGREKRNGLSRNGRQNCGVYGLIKVQSIMRQSLGFEQSLAEAWNKHLIIWSHCLPPETG